MHRRVCVDLQIDTSVRIICAQRAALLPSGVEGVHDVRRVLGVQDAYAVAIHRRSHVDINFQLSLLFETLGEEKLMLEIPQTPVNNSQNIPIQLHGFCPLSIALFGLSFPHLVLSFRRARREAAARPCTTGRSSCRLQVRPDLLSSCCKPFVFA